MKKILNFVIISVLISQLNAFDFNGMWSYNISPKGYSESEAEYSWGTVQEPYDIGFSIDLDRKIIHTNCFRSFIIYLDYNKESKTFSFINPLTKEKETYYITEISDYEIKLETEYFNDRNPLIHASQKGGETNFQFDLHYFKIAGPKDSKVLKAPVKAKLLSDIELKFKDYKGLIYNFGVVKKGTIVEVVNCREGAIPEITDLDFIYHVLINPELGGYVDPKKIEFLDDITINGYGGKKNH